MLGINFDLRNQAICRAAVLGDVVCSADHSAANHPRLRCNLSGGIRCKLLGAGDADVSECEGGHRI